MTERALPAATCAALPCWGCALGVPLRDGEHEEPAEVAGMVYAYPCTAPVQKDSSR